MSVHIEEKNGVEVISIIGKLDVGLSISLETEIEKLIDSKHIFIVVDLSSVEYLSSSGLRVFISSMRKLKDKSGKFALACVPEIVTKIFKTVELEDLFSVYGSVADAVSELGD